MHFSCRALKLLLLSGSTSDTMLERDMLPDFQTTLPPSIRHSAEGCCCICPIIPKVLSQKMKSDQGSFAPGDFWCSENLVRPMQGWEVFENLHVSGMEACQFWDVEAGKGIRANLETR
jgi:hypothetical protein